jgi:xylulokinase
MYLGFDLGTTNVKAVVVDGDGSVIGTGAAPVERFTTSDGGVEQDIERIWDATCKAIRLAIAELDANRIRAVGVSSQGGAMQLLDEAQQPVGRVISWLDGRGRPFDEMLTRELGQDFLAQHIGHGASEMTLGQILRLQKQSPDQWRKARYIAFVGDVIVGRLCGRRAHDPTSLAIAMLYNPWRCCADTNMLARMNVEEDQLPDLLPATTPAGTIHTEAGRATGLPKGIPVSPAIHDQYAVSLGSRSVHEGNVTFGAGTAWVLLAHGRQLAPPITLDAFVCPHPVPGLFGQMLSMRNGGSAIDWVLKLLGHDKASPDAVDRLVEKTSPGSDGVRFWPLLTPIVAANHALSSGGRITGIPLAHQPHHLLRAVVEGLACELARHLQLLTDAGIPAQRLMMCGSAASSRTTPQIIADTTQRPVTSVHGFDLSALGAATLAKAMANNDANFAGLTTLPASSGETVMPGEHSAFYRDLLEQYLQPFGHG